MTKTEGFIGFIVVAMLVGIIIARYGSGTKDSAKLAVQDQGFTEVVIGNYTWLGGSEDDWTAYEFTAKNPNGKYVNGIVSGGGFKGWTIRFRH